MSLRTTFFALTYDRQMAGTERAGLRAFRERLLAGAHGDVLEIGGGTGANLPCYGPDVTSLAITEPEPAMLRRLQRRIGEQPAGEPWPSARVLRAPAEDLPFEDHSFDVAVSTLVLCGVDDQPRDPAGTAQGAAAQQPAPVHRASPLRRPRSGPPAGPDELAQPAGRLLRLQPPHPRLHPAGRLHGRSTGAHHAAEGPEVRGAGRPGPRHSTRGRPRSGPTPPRRDPCRRGWPRVPLTTERARFVCAPCEGSPADSARGGHGAGAGG